MKLITWNIQWCRGVDGRVDPRRIVEHARRLADFDVLCLQEVAGVAVDIPDGRGGRRLFGNMVLSRYPVARIIRHALPYPPEPGLKTMPRLMIEAVVEAPFGPVRVMTTHCEYNSQRQRAAQVEAMRAVQQEAAAFECDDDQHVGDGGTFKWLPRPSAAILTADFNMRGDNPALARLVEPFEDGTPAFRDAWNALNGEAPQPHTVGVYDREQWPEAHACDFIFLTENLVPRLRNVVVDQESAASDHQPILVELAD